MENNLTYIQNGDYLIPDLVLKDTREYHIGKYGLLRERFLMEHRKGVYSAMQLDGTLYAHLQEVDELARDCFSLLVKELAEREGVREQLKAENKLEWVGRMNNIRNRADEIVCNEYIYV